MENAIEIKNLTKSYKEFKLDSISFNLPAGTIMGLIGENGAGKSTTIKLIMNAIEKDSGEVNVLGVCNTDPDFSEVKEDIGIVLDEAYFPETITAAVVSKVMAATYKNWNDQKYWSFIKNFNLPDKVAFKDYSRGMRMKLAIAAALSHDPKLLILDEATSGLDPIVRDEILDIFYDFTRDQNHSILISSHIVSDLEKLCDYITFIHKGKLEFCEEKDMLHEEYGIIRCTNEELSNLPQSAICGIDRGKYGTSCLVRKKEISSSIAMEKASIEDIILYKVKGDVVK